MRDIRTMNGIAGHKIENDEIIKRTGYLQYRNIGTFAQMTLFDSGKALIIDSAGEMAISDDCFYWKRHSIPSAGGMSGITYGDGLFVAPLSAPGYGYALLTSGIFLPDI